MPIWKGIRRVSADNTINAVSENEPAAIVPAIRTVVQERTQWPMALGVTTFLLMHRKGGMKITFDDEVRI